MLINKVQLDQNKKEQISCLNIESASNSLSYKKSYENIEIYEPNINDLNNNYLL
jgi:hypothetical protein